MSKRERDRGKLGERELAAVFRARRWPNARRGQQRSGLDQADVVDGPDGCHFEVKRVERLVWRTAMQQAIDDAAAATVAAGALARSAGGVPPSSVIPVVATRRNQDEWFALLRLDDLLDMLEVVEDARCWDARGREDSRGLLD
ncbi:MAG: hypothetical protein DRJ50_14940 [Actinobacteria bacterium]|nr:MAG: hypothetical protein DRJ50_14940 [Actinomycetota bacterium]